MENEMKFQDKIEEVSNIMDNLLGNRSLISEAVAKKYNNNKLTICLRNLMRFRDIDIMLKIVMTMIKLFNNVGTIFDSNEAANDFQLFDTNLMYCFKLLYK